MKTKPTRTQNKTETEKGSMPYVRHKSLPLLIRGSDHCLLLKHHLMGWKQITINSLFDMA